MPKGKTKVAYWEDKEILDFLKCLYAEIGRRPKESDIKRKKYIGFSTIVVRFNGLLNACRAAGIPVDKKLSYSTKECLKALEEVCELLGYPPTRKHYYILGKLPSATTITKTFGSWSNAIEQVGLKAHTGVAGKAWKTWEKIVEDCSFFIYGKKNIELQYVYKGKRTIDVFIRDKKIGIDAKYSAYTQFETQNKQLTDFINSKKFKRVELWCLHVGNEYVDKKIKYIYPADIIVRLEQVHGQNKQKHKLKNKIKNALENNERFRKESGLITRKELLNEMTRFYEKHKRIPPTREFKKYGLRSSSTYIKLFGDITNIYIEMGLPPMKTYWRKYTDNELYEVFERFIQEECGGMVPNAKQLLYNKNYPSIAVYVRRAGTYNQWLKGGGYELNEEYKLDLSNKDSLIILKKVYKQIGRPLASKDKSWREEYGEFIPSKQWYVSRFGTWNNALNEANIPVCEEFEYNLSNKDALEILRDAYSKIKSPLSSKNQSWRKKYGKFVPSSSWYRKRFGSWCNAAKKARIPSNRNENHNINKVDAIKLLKKAYSIAGIQLVGKNNDWHKYLNEHAPSTVWYRKKFSGWLNALKTANIPHS